MKNYQGLKKLFEKKSNAKQARQMSAYMRNLFSFYGIPATARKECYKAYLREEKKAKAINWDFLDLCWADSYREFQYAAKDYLVAVQQTLAFEHVVKIEQYIRTKAWWDTIDGLDRIVGNIGLRDGRIDALMIQWSVDENFWVRRVAIDHQLLRKDKTNTELLEKILVNNFGSDEFFINKAIGWSLRDYAKTNPAWVRDFISRHRHTMSTLSIREASKYIAS